MAKTPTINETIQNLIDHTIQQQPTITKIYLTKIYTDNKYCDIKTLNGDTLEHIQMISNNPAVNNVGILVPLPNDEWIVITK